MGRAARHAAALALALIAPPSARADGEVTRLITPNDTLRLDAYAATRAAALGEARADGNAADIAVLDALIGATDLPIRDFDIAGRWKCRTIKTGKLLPIVIYGWFECSVEDTDIGYVLRKTTGSQRTTGRFFDDGDSRMIYLGSLHVNDEPVKPYGTGPETDQVGLAFRNAGGGWRIEFPAPYYESLLDILEFKRP
ncbi:MAG: DUF4893 domain-containing protein [Rhizobiaceae bacterium]|jgi:hypothetical protein|nr:DUF4893 domain-containing protein [Rhizobiaceae bacterium]